MSEKIIYFKHEFVEFVPERIESGVLYVSMPYATVIHRCACGCGQEVVTPLSPTDWKMIFDGKSISLDPSIGNWSFDCRSHYFIRNNHVLWCDQWSKERINFGRAYDTIRKQSYYGAGPSIYDDDASSLPETLEPSRPKSLLEKLRHFWPF